MARGYLQNAIDRSARIRFRTETTKLLSHLLSATRSAYLILSTVVFLSSDYFQFGPRLMRINEQNLSTKRWMANGKRVGRRRRAIGEKRSEANHLPDRLLTDWRWQSKSVKLTSSLSTGSLSLESKDARADARVHPLCCALAETEQRSIADRNPALSYTKRIRKNTQNSQSGEFNGHTIFCFSEIPNLENKKWT